MIRDCTHPECPQRERIKDLEKAIEGNGKPGLIGQMAEALLDIGSMKTNLDWIKKLVMIQIGMLASVLGSIIVGIVITIVRSM